jgi:hypothetical protein
MRYVKMILTGLVGLSLLAMIFALLMPSSVKISRGVIIDADSAAVEQVLLDADKWNEWVPWLHKKTGLLVQQKGEHGKEGFEMRWQSIEGENSGRITYIGKQPGTLLFSYEFNDMNRSEGGFRIRKIAEGRTEVQWFMEYPLKWYPWERFYGIFVDGMIGSVFEIGLQELIKLTVASGTPNT